MRVCPNCQATVSDTANFCDNCGRPFRSNPVVPRGASQGAQPPVPGYAGARPSPEAGLCSACGYRNVPSEMFCQNCGVQLAPVASTPPPPPRPLSGPPERGLPAVPPSEPAAGGICPECGVMVGPGDAFCLNCGVSLQKPGGLTGGGPPDAPAAGAPSDGITANDRPAGGPAGFMPPSAPPPAQEPLPIPRPMVLPELVFTVKETHTRLTVPRQLDIVIGRSDPVRGIFPDVDVTPAGGDTHGVSRKHARVFFQDGQFYIEDLNSTNFTFLNRQRLQPGHPYPINDGDEIRVGLLGLQVSIH